MMKKQKNTIQIKTIAIILIIIVISFLITSYSSVINPFSDDDPYDSWIFRYMGMLILKGGLPYRDAFEQKGPLLFIYEAIGILINKEFGIWILELISMIIFMFLTYRLCRLFAKSFPALIISIASVGSFSIFFSGNMSEEFALPFMAASIIIYTDYLLFNKYTDMRIMLCGFCCGAVFMLRPNMVALWIVMSIAVIINSVKQSKKFPGRMTLLFSSGFFIPIIPIIIWFSVTGALHDFINQYFLFNFQYTAEPHSITEQLGVMWDFSKYSMLIIPIIILTGISIKYKKYRFFNITFICYILLNLILCTVSVRGYLHYGMPLVTCHAYPLILLFNVLTETDKYGDKRIGMLPYLLCIVYSFTLIVFFCNNVRTLIISATNDKLTETDHRMIAEIQELTSPDDKILVIGKKSWIYYESDRLCSSIYFIQEPIYELNSLLKEDIKNDINENYPKLYINGYSGEIVLYDELFDHLDEYTLYDKQTKIYILSE